MLIAFEGQDGAGKSALLRAVFTELTRQGVATRAVDEFSNSPYGKRLVDALERDKFMRPTPGEAATTLTRILDVVADLYYFDERVIGPALQAGHVVLKDRHLDTVLYTAVPELVATGAVTTDSEALTWLSMMLSRLRYRPVVTVYVDAPLHVRLARIKKRPRRFPEDRGRKVSREDLAVFTARESVAKRLMAAEPARFVVVDNSRPLSEGVSQVLALVHSLRPDLS